MYVSTACIAKRIFSTFKFVFIPYFCFHRFCSDFAASFIPKMNQSALAARSPRKIVVFIEKFITSDCVAVVLKVAHKQFNRLSFLCKLFSFPETSCFE